MRAIKTKSKLFKSAAKLINKYGYDNVTIGDISKLAGVSVGAFYHYYDSKTDIVVEFFKRIDVYFEKKSPEILTGEDPGVMLTNLFRCYADYHIDMGFDHTRMILKVQNSFFVDRTRYLYVMLLDIVRRGQKTGIFDGNIAAESIGDYFLVVARGLLFDWVLEKSEYDLTEKMIENIERSKRAFLP
ncbi:MAG: TetR/AcrR family transcriptional regulator [Clostridiales Family XIII bacterium]|nr:TetR/AcrR family transcriptional regulator [Clostridiales Family XIII bacterium]